MALQHLDSVEQAADWLLGCGASGLTTDSRRLRAGEAFLAWPGRAHDARVEVRQALAGGASACLVEADGVAGFAFESERRVAAFTGLKRSAGPVASRFLGQPSQRLRVIACTGTNGKTSSTWWIAQALTRLGVRCGVAGTLGIGEPPAAGPLATASQPPMGTRTGAGAGTNGAIAAPAPVGAAPLAMQVEGLTTPDAVTLQHALRAFVDAGLDAAAIEASSIGIAEHRLAGTRLDTALFTNLTQDHLDYHGEMDAYRAAKASLFDWPGLRAAVVNIDDVAGLALAETLSGRPLDLWTCACAHSARLRATGIRHGARGLAFEVREGAQQVEVETALIGRYNVSNLLGVIGVLRAGGIGLAAAAAVCVGLLPVPGRMQRVAAGPGGEAEPQVIVDYAHTPDALDKALAALRPFAEARGGKLWCVFGCGGNRDAAKRPLMGALACRLADRVIVTSDNPRAEPPDFIISQILAGVIGHDEVDVIENRAEAVRHAVVDAGARDVILVAGKGHEDYQEVAGVRHPYSDVAAAEAALQQRGSRRC